MANQELIVSESEPCLHYFLHDSAPFKSNVIYHYTSLETMKCFFDVNSDFLCSDYKHLKDQTEYDFGIAACFSYMIEQGYIPGTYRDFITDVAKNVNPWTMSFSSAKDSPSLWKEYAPRGVSIGFATSDLDQITLEMIKDVARNDMSSFPFLAPCFYDKEDIHKVLEFSFSTYIPYLAQVRISNPVDKAYICNCFLNKERLGSFQDPTETKVLSVVFSVICVLAALIKDRTKYRHEQEYRLVIAPLPGCKPSKLLLINKRARSYSGIGKHLQSKGLKIASLFREIIVSPNDTDLEIINLVSTLKSKHVLEVDLSKSKA